MKPIKIDWYSVKTKVVVLILLYFLMHIFSQLPYLNYLSSYLYLPMILFIASIWATTGMPWWRLILYCIGIEAVKTVLFLAISAIPVDGSRFYYLIIDELTICVHLFLQYLLLRKLYGWNKISFKKKDIVLLAVYLTCLIAYRAFEDWYYSWWASQLEDNLLGLFMGRDPYGVIVGFFSLLVANMRMLIFSVILRNSNMPREEAVIP